ncbi:MAG: hypothetical protein AMXMBFR42_30150 [Burkholderiales bacterium]
MTTIVDIDVRTWATKSLRECASIAGRGAPAGRKGAIDPARTGAVLDKLIEALRAERRALADGAAK